MGMVAGVFAAIGGLVIGTILAIIVSVVSGKSKTGPALTFLYVAKYTVPGSFIVLFGILLQVFSGGSLFNQRPNLPPLSEPTHTPGPFTRKFDTGEIMEEGFLNEYALPSEVVGFYRSGEKAYERTYRMTGITKRTWENFDHHVLDEWREWYANGQLRSERVSLNKESLRYNFVWWYENGEKKMETQHLNDKAVGVQRYWTDTGILLCEMTINEKGRITSKSAWYPNGVQQFRSGPKYAKNGWEGESWDWQGKPKGGSLIKTSCDSIPKFKRLSRSEQEWPERFQGRQSN
jgi:hypothetical protein